MSALWFVLGAIAIASHTEGWDAGRQHGWSECRTVPEVHAAS